MSQTSLKALKKRKGSEESGEKEEHGPVLSMVATEENQY